MGHVRRDDTEPPRRSSSGIYNNLFLSGREMELRSDLIVANKHCSC
jgi:hypothetical protein